MSLFSWLFSTSKSNPPTPVGASDGVSATKTSAAPADPLTELKQQRHLNRESLYEVVRSVMLRSEVLSSHYKFKVLSLDARGRQFLVMIDLLNDSALQPHRWSGIEQLMTLTALQHHDLEIKGLYWRLMMQPATAGATPQSKSDTTPPRVAPLAAATAAPSDDAIAAPLRGFEPIHQDEVLAFKKAIADATPAEESQPETGKVIHSGPRRPPPEHGYEDTQLLEPEDGASPLSKTQFGGLD